MIERIIKEDDTFRLILRKQACLKPKGVFNLEFVQEQLDDEGEITATSTYQFFMKEQEIQKLCQVLL